MTTTTVRKLQLGYELRRLREAAKRTPAEAAAELDCTTAKISRLETGENAISLGDLKLLLSFYGTAIEQTAWLIELSRDNRRRGRWKDHRATYPEWFRTYVELERDAEDIRIVESEIVPGLLQTEAYMRALFQRGTVLDEVPDPEVKLKARLERQQVLTRDDPPTISVVLSESCVRRMICSPEVMAEQLSYLADLADGNRVQLQLHTFDTESTKRPRPYSLLRVPMPNGGAGVSFAYCEDVDDGRYVDEPRALRLYEVDWGAQVAAALNPVATRDMLRAMASRLI